MTTFRALVVEKEQEQFELGIKELSLDDLPESEVTIKVAYSSINYKDGLASTPNGRIVRRYPLILGIDLAGVVIDSKVARFREGDQVLVTGYKLGVSHHGGFSEYARLPADWVVPLPEGLTLQEAMAIGTAGFTAALSIQRLEDNGLAKERGAVLVTGATGGVGSHGVAMLAKLGYHVVASTGKETEETYLKGLGAKKVLARQELLELGERSLEKERWAGVIDPVGGAYLPYILKSVQYGGSVAVSGLTGGPHFETSVFPFILRGINLLGIDSVYCPMETRLRLWNRISEQLKPTNMLQQLAREIPFEALPQALASILSGSTRGRMIVRL